MSQPSASDALRYLLIAGLGLSFFACGDAETDPQLGGSGGGNPQSGGMGGTDSGGSGGAMPTGGTNGKLIGSECTNPTPFLEDVDSGFFQCDEGYLHRAERKSCPSVLPRDNMVEPLGEGGSGPNPSECSTDSDCSGELEYCAVVGGGPSPEYAACLSSCISDDDCDDGEVCVCGEEFGTCAPGKIDEVPGGCQIDADCPDGELCAGVFLHQPCDPGIYKFSCTPIDVGCTPRQGDCYFGDRCSVEGGRLECESMAVCGRPFLVQGADRKALAMARSDWLLEPCNSGQVGRERGASEQQQREVAAAYFERIALMEHASIAAFARFQLQLLSLGAPARFVEATNQALVDETKHARLAFALASRFAERELGPGALETRGAFEDDSLASILQTTIVEGCVGETIAALEARAALQQCEDDQVRAALEQIADDETRHAQLAWQVVQWILQERPELATLAREVFASASAPSGPSVDHNLAEPSSGAPAYGVLASEDLARVHDEARLKVVRPCADQMLGALTSADSHGVLPTGCEHFMPGS